jgi:enolase
MSIISDIKIQIRLDGTGKPGISVLFRTDKGKAEAFASVSSSASESALSLSSLQSNIQYAKNSVIPHLIGICTSDQTQFDAHLHEIDGTNDLNQITPDIARALSYANAHAAAMEYENPLYRHLGGVYAGEIPLPFLHLPCNESESSPYHPVLVPTHATSMEDLIPVISMIYQRKIPKEDGISSNEDLFEQIRQICGDVLEGFGITLQPGLICKSVYAEDKQYHLNNMVYTSDEYIQHLIEFVQAHDIIYLESPLDGGDTQGYASLTSEIGDKTLIANQAWKTASDAQIHMHDVLTSTNSMIISPSIGTITDIYEMNKRAQKHGLETIIGDGVVYADPTCAHIGCACGCIGIQIGQYGQGIETLNELISIEESL